MGAVHGGVVRQGGQALERETHLRRGAFEQAAAAAGEQGVATEQPGLLAIGSVGNIGDMATGMARHGQHAHRQIDAGHGEAIAVVHAHAGGNALIWRSEHRHGGMGKQAGYTTNMVSMVMGE